MIKIDREERIIRFKFNQKLVEDPNFSIYSEMDQYGVMRTEKRPDGDHVLRVSYLYKVQDVAEYIQSIILYYFERVEPIE